ncbi:MAG: hypothetical protein OXM57_01285 [bacterium]|nr:hypothetical protein [bacterium]MDE0351313.1 hypothetical protein [bacterium]
MTRGRLALLVAISVLAVSCYLPRAEGDRDVETFILASVRQCSSESVGGTLRNDADVAVRLELVAMWLDLASEVYHEVGFTVDRVEAESEVPYSVDAGADVDPPLICTVETSSVEVIE